MDQNIKIKEWAEADRPREKLLQHGRRYLTDVELIAVLIRSGSRMETAVELSRKILIQYNKDLNDLGRASVKELSKFKGMGMAKASTIVAALELGRRRIAVPLDDVKKLTCSKDAYNYMLPYFADLNHEEFWIILLSRANVIISRHLISTGGQAGTVVDPKIIFKTALENNAASIILAHNHPSGQLKASGADLSITKKLVEAGKMMEIFIHDHLIITNSGYFSFADEGLINPS